MKRFINCLLLIVTIYILLGNTFLFGQTPPSSCVIQGYVKDKTTKLPVPNALVILQFLSKNTTKTDQNGFFKFTDVYPFPTLIQVTGDEICPTYVNVDVTEQDTTSVIIEARTAGKVSGNVIDEQKQPIPYAHIQLSQADSEGNHIGKSQNTNDNGEFQISGIDPDSPISSIVASAAGFNSNSKENLGFPPGQKVLNFTFQLSSTASNDTTSSNDTTYNHQYITITGDVKSLFYKPIAGAEVSNAALQNYNNYKSTKTDLFGRFTLSDIPAEKNGDSFKFESIGFYAKASGYAPIWKRMTSAQDTIIHFVLPDGHYVGGRVIDPDNNPIPLVIGHIELTPQDTSDYWQDPVNQEFSVDSEGHFRIEDLPMGMPRCGFFKPGYTLLPETTLQIDKEENVVILEPSEPISGTVVDDVTGKPITAFFVLLGYPNDTSLWNGTIPLIPVFEREGIWFTPEDGKFSMTNFGMGTYFRIIIKAEGYQKEEIDTSTTRGYPFKEKYKLEFRMRKAKLVNGIVVDNAIGRGIAGVRVFSLIPKYEKHENINILWDNFNRIKGLYAITEATTDTNGRFQFNSLSGTEGNIAVMSNGYGRSILTHLDLTQFITVKLPKAASIKVLLGTTVFSKNTITMFLSNYENMVANTFENKTPDKGGEIVYTDLPPGDYSFYINKNNTGINGRITLTEGQNYVLDLTVTPIIKVKGKVLYKGSSIQQASVYTYCEDTDAICPSVPTDKEGNYEILLSIPGKYRFDFSIPYTGPNFGEYPFQIISRKTLSVVSGEYRLDCNLPDSAIQGLVLNPKTGKPVPKTQISAYQKKKGDESTKGGWAGHYEYNNLFWSHFKTMQTDENGRFSFTNMESGEWLIAEKTESGTIYATKTFQLKANETKDNLVLMEPDSGSLVVTVLDQDSGYRVFPVEMGCADTTGFVYPPVFEKSTTPFLLTQKIAMDSTGKVTYPNLPIGKYKLYARTADHPTGSTDIEIFSSKTTEASLRLKKGGRLVIPLKDKLNLTQDEQVYCKLKILKAKDGNPIMQDANGLYKKTGFYFNSLSLDSSFIMPLPSGEYPVDLQINYYSQNRKTPGFKPQTQTKLLKIEEDKGTTWEINLSTLRKMNK